MLKSVWLLSASALVLLPASSLAAQDRSLGDQRDVEAAKDAEEIVVTGFRKGELEAVQAKRDAFIVSDAIVSDDIGRLPDQNTAAALRRIPGISVQEDQNEPRFPSIRGLPPTYNRTQINGAIVATGDNGGSRTVPLDTVPSTFAQRLEVFRPPPPEPSPARATQLVCANSNYPQTPMASTVEIFDTRTMTHLRSIPLGVRDGSLTWIERRGKLWWAGFANYDPPRSHLGRTHRDTRIVLFNAEWAEIGGYALPDTVLGKLAPHSVSGGSFGPDGLLYLTGHDAPEVYVVRVPKQGPVLEHVATIAAPIEGQAWAWDRSAQRTIFAISRSKAEVIALTMPAVCCAAP